MKIIITVVVLLALVASFSIWGRAATNSIGNAINDATPAEFDVEVAKTAVKDLRSELVDDNKNLLALRRDVERTERDVERIGEEIETLANQIKSGGALLAQSGDSFTINGREYPRAQVQTQVESYLTERGNKRDMQAQRERHLVMLRSRLAEMESLIADKRVRIEDYESQIAMLEIDVRFQSNVDRYNVATGNTDVQEVIDRLSDKVASQQYETPGAGGIDFIEDDGGDLQERITAELSE